MVHGSVFSGIGAPDLAAEWMGWQNAFHCELNEFCRKVLKYYWPEAVSYEDIRTTDFTVWRGIISILTGGFPCQPFSLSGKRLGTEDERNLWPEMLRAIREIQPRWVVGENVYGLISWNRGMVFNQVQIDLEAEGYEVQPVILPAAGVNAPHRRERIWFIAHNAANPISERRCSGESNWKDAVHAYPSGKIVRSGFNGTGWPTEPPLCFTNDGLSQRLAGITFSGLRRQANNALGNSMVPQVVLQIFKAIQQYEQLKRA